MKEHREADELGKMKDVTARLKLKRDASPKFFRSRSVPFATRDFVGAEIDQLEKMGILEKANHSNGQPPLFRCPRKMGSSRSAVTTRSLSI